MDESPRKSSACLLALVLASAWLHPCLAAPAVADPSGPRGSVAAAAGERLEFLPLRPLLFGHDADNLNGTDVVLLEDMAAFMRRDPRIRRVLIKGHTDAIASGPYNEALSTRRAETVRGQLIAFGVPPWLLHVTALGRSAPTDEDWTPEGRARNRRVEIYVVREGD